MASKDQGGEAAKSAGKKKGKTIALNDFLKPKSVGRWADDDVETDALEDLPPLPTAPGDRPALSAGGSGSLLPPSSRPLPDQPPFKVFIGNIPYDATSQEMGDVFLPELQVKDVHIIKHKDTNKPRGCFVEFTSCADLEKALLKDGTMVMGRPIRVDVAEDRSDRSRSGAGGFGRSDRDMDSGRDRDRDRRPGYGFGDAGYEEDRRGGGGGGGGFEDRRGGRGFADTYGPDRGRPGGYDEVRGGDRRGGHGGGEGRHGYGGFSGRHEEETSGGRWGHIERGPAHAAPPPHARAHSPPQRPQQQQLLQPDDGPRERPKLALAPRSAGAPGEEPAAAGEAQPDTPAVPETPVKKKVNPFGDAKPVDADAKLREIEERMHKRKMEDAAKRAADAEAARTAEMRARAAAARPANGAPHDDDAVSSTSGASAEPRAAMGGRGGRRGGRGGGRGRGGGPPEGGRGERPGPPGLGGEPQMAPQPPPAAAAPAGHNRGWEGRPPARGGGPAPPPARGGGPGHAPARPRSGGSSAGEGGPGRGQGPGRGGGQGRGPPGSRGGGPHHRGGDALRAPAEPVKDAAGFQMVGGGHHKGGRGRKQEGAAAAEVGRAEAPKLAANAAHDSAGAGPPGLPKEQKAPKATVSNKFAVLNMADEPV